MKLLKFTLIVILFANSLYAQVLDRPTRPVPTRPIPTRPIDVRPIDPPQASLPVEYSEKEEAEDERENHAALRLAYEYLLENREEINFLGDAQSFQELEEAIKYNNYSRLSEKELIETELPSKQSIVTQSFFNNYLELGHSLLAQQDGENLWESYHELYEALPVSLKRQVTDPRRLSPSDPKSLERAHQQMDELIEKNLNVILDSQKSDLKSLSEKSLSFNPVRVDASSETGYLNLSAPRTGDEAGRCTNSQYHAQGLIGLTSIGRNRQISTIKQQGNRGSCAAFAITATFEGERIRRGLGNANYSEQSLYAYAKLVGASSNKFADGLNTKDAVKKLKNKSYRFTPESMWVYNPSWKRAKNRSNNRYADSCLDYAPWYCSNYSFQSHKKNGKWEYIGASSGPRISNWSSHKKSNKNNSMNALIALNRPAVIAMNVTESFMNVGAQGTLNSGTSSHGKNKGGHAMMYIGYVPNSARPAGLRAASGGGYVVVKNSWGKNNGDCGFYYLDHNYVKDRLTAIITITPSN